LNEGGGNEGDVHLGRHHAFQAVAGVVPIEGVELADAFAADLAFYLLGEEVA
jgi:hypothetical protein